MTDASTLVMPTENRKHQRINVRLPASIVVDHLEISVTLINISTGGVMLEVPSHMIMGSKKIQVRLLADADLFPGEIKWSGLNAIGIEFQAEGSSRTKLNECVNTIMRDHASD